MLLKANKLSTLLFLIALTGSISNTNACLILTNDTEINTDTTLCRGDYQFNDNDNDGIIKIISDNLKLDCNGSYIRGDNSGKGIYNLGNNINITNCNISNYEYGIYISSKNDIIIQDSFILHNHDAGIYLTGSKNINILNNTIKNNGPENGVFSGGISISNANITIINNTIEENIRGINILSGYNNNISTNKIRKNNNNIFINTLNAKYTRVYTNLLEPGTTYSGTGTISINNIFADWTAGPADEFLADFETITEALSTASTNNIIYAFKKIYAECLNITKTLTINGEEKTTTKINCTGNIALNISADNVKFSNFTIISNTLNYLSINLAGNYAHISNITIQNQNIGIQILNTNHHLLKYIKLTNTAYAINITSSDNTTITLSEFTNSSIHTHSSTSTTIHNSTFTTLANTTLQNTNNSNIANNTYETIFSPVKIISSANTNITKNTFLTNIYYPIILEYATNSKITENSIIYANYSITTENSDTLTISRNIINNTQETAIRLKNTNSTHITNNTITTAKKAITIEAGNTNTIYNNTITGITETSIEFTLLGIHTPYHNNTIEKNTITNSNKAISAQNTHKTKITQNTITAITGAQSITIINTTHDNITQNTFDTGTTAITLKNADNTQVQSNNFSNYAQTSIEFDTTSYNTENTIKDNTITGGIYPLKILHNFKSRITNNTITGQSTSTGIGITNTNSTNITNNTIQYTFVNGIIFSNSENNLIDNNTIRHIVGRGISSNGITQNPSTISNNYIQNTSYGIYLQNIMEPEIIGNIITLSNNEAIHLYGINNATIKSNTISTINPSTIGLYIENSKFNNITENTFQNNPQGIELKSENNNLWLNNFSDTNNVFKDNNDYCIMGLDNYYYTNDPPYNDPPLSCNRLFHNEFNDTAIYTNETIEFKTNTIGGESNYTSLNITINNTNHTMTLAEGNNITGNWTYTFKDTLLPGTYRATLLYYHEADYDEGAEQITGMSFEVMELSMTIDIMPDEANINETIFIEATVQNNATPIDNVTSNIYWNNTLIDTQNQTTFTESEGKKRYWLQTNKTERSGTYTVNTTVYAGKEKTDTNTFQINYGHTLIEINETPQLTAYNRTTTQNYTITAIEGDLKNITITFVSNDTSIINITTPTQIIPYLNASDTLELYINITAGSTGIAKINITAAPTNGTSDSETKDITVKKINMTAHIFPQVANVTQNITIEAEVWDNVTEITGVVAEIYWNNTPIATLTLGHYEMTTTLPDTIHYIYKNTTNQTQRSGNYTVLITATATNNATETKHYYINYGTANITIYQTPSAMNTNTQKQQYINITAINGDLNHTILTFASTSKSVINITTPTQLIQYLNSSDTQNIYINLTANNTGTAQINITATPSNGNTYSKTKNITVKELTLEASLSRTTINITQTIQLHANITGNITNIEYITANITWNQTSKQNITLHYHHYYPAEEKHAYTGTITNTGRSGNYEAFIEAKADITINTTETFFVNYGQPEITFGPDPQKLNVSENRTQEITIKPNNGDLANITIKLTSDNETILNLSDTQDPIQTIDYIFYATYNELKGETVQYNITGKSVGTANITVNITSENNSPETGKKEIEVTGTIESNAPNVTAIWTNSSIDTYNLLDSITIYANISDDSGLETKIAEITKPDGHKENKTMTWSGTGNTYKTQDPFTNTTNTSNYTIKIHAIDYYGNANNTETKNFTLTNIYPTTIIDTYSRYNRGENATITIHVYDINNNPVHNFNTTLNITYESNTTTLLENNQTDTYTYYINTSILGIHNLSANITKNGNTASNTSTFNVTNTLDMSYYTSLTIYPPTSWIRELRLYTNYKRGDPYTDNLNASLYCYNDSSNHWGIVPLAKSSSNTYTYTSEGDPQCYAPSPSCQQFKITANITDPYNNTGTKILSLSTSGCTSEQSSSSGSGSSSGGGTIVEYIQNTTDNWKDFIRGSETNRTIITDFKFTLSKKEIIIKQGENATIIATLNNIGDTYQKIIATITKQCCNITLKQKTYSIPPRNKKDIPIRIHASLTTPSGEYLTTVTMTTENITMPETFKIRIRENPLINTMKNLEKKIKEHQKEIESYKKAGVDTTNLEKMLDEIKSHIENAKQYIQKDNLKNLEAAIKEANSKSYLISLELVKLKTTKWLYENKYLIAATIILIIIFSYLSIYFIIPYCYLKKDLKDLKSKELQLKDAEKSVQKQYFMRQLDEVRFNELLSEKHSALLDTRSEIKQIQEKIILLTKGKLNLKKEEHSKYFILNKITKKKQAPKEKKLQIKEKIKSLKEQEYNLNQSTKEAEKNYYSRIITQEELEQITNNNRAKLQTIQTQLHTQEKLQKSAPKKQPKKENIITKLKQKYTQYKLQKQKERIENKIDTLQKHENILEEKDKELQTKEEQIKKQIETLKNQDNSLKEQEKQSKDSE